MFEKMKAKIALMFKKEEGIDQEIKNRINKEFKEKEEEIKEEAIEEAIYEGKEKINEKFKYLFKEFFIKIIINLSPIVAGLIIYLLNPTDFSKKILIVGYGISILIGLYEFIKFSIKSWKFLSPIVEYYFELKKLNMYSTILLKMRIQTYLEEKFLINDLYDGISDKAEEKIEKKLNKDKLYKNLKDLGYEYKNKSNDANEIAQYMIDETEVPSIVWEELVKYIKYSLFSKWLFASILVISYIVIFRMFLLPIMINSL